jgi:small-conductance mechanosensitive channel
VPVPAPVDLEEAALDLASGFFGDLDASEILLEYAPIQQPPYVLAGVGLAIGILCGLTFARLIQNRLDGWKQDRLALLPLGTVETTLSYTGVILGVTLFIGGCLSVFGFSLGVALLVSFVLSMGTAGALWVQLERLMEQVQSGNFKAVDFDNFDEFF